MFLYRVRELLAARMVVDKFLPFSHFSGSWEELIGTVTTEGQCTPFPALTSRRVKHLVVEMFVATKKVGGVLPPVSSVPLFSPLSRIPYFFKCLCKKNINNFKFGCGHVQQ